MFDLGDLARFPPRFYRLLRLSATPPGRLSDLFSCLVVPHRSMRFPLKIAYYSRSCTK